MDTLRGTINRHPVRLRYAIALISFVATVGLFASLADEVHDGDTLAVDRSILISIRSSFASPQLDSFMSIATDIGGTEVIAFATLGLAAFFIYRHAYSKAMITALTMGGIAMAVTLLKLIFGRERPDIGGSIVNEQTFSFPSGHAMGSAGLAILVAVLMWRTKWQWPVTILAGAYMLFVGFSRLYLSVHYPTDVFAGWILAAAWVTAVFTVFRASKRLRV